MISIFWSELAKIDFIANIKYLENKWTSNEVFNFIDKVTEIIDLLAKDNITFKSTVYKNTYKVPVLKQITLYYRYENNSIELLRFWNNYQDIKNISL